MKIGKHFRIKKGHPFKHIKKNKQVHKVTVIILILKNNKKLTKYTIYKVKAIKTTINTCTMLKE